ncbi:nucleotide exchange factor GrpE [Sinosporangium siamense]|uniref:Protein GrpE n=1 Tax=Sinosporangium siamense TaxID=1367973 RepID=A0A919RL68_9ACTN|nr:nucleotide exchange factor GrpE [Sinosporangium siamense]GII93969.1 protein GrpE [Sinosporangium siamense]
MSEHDPASAPPGRPHPERAGPDQDGFEQTGAGRGGPEQAAPEGRPDRAEELEALVARLEQRVAELEDQWLRALAELDNMRKRAAREAEWERARMFREWLPVLDHLDLALQHAEAEPASLAEGVSAVRDQALALLERYGYARQDDAGAGFDPARHEAVGAVPAADVPSGTVVGVVRPGYGEGDHQLRPAAVIVSKAD